MERIMSSNSGDQTAKYTNVGPLASPPQFSYSLPFSPANNDRQNIPVLHAEFPLNKKPRISPENFAGSEILNARNPYNSVKSSKLFYKTRLCERFKSGTCPYESNNCNFAHGFEDMRKPPPNWQSLVSFQGDGRMGNWEDDESIISRMKICKRFSAGLECRYGNRCNFLHEHPSKFREDQLRFRESSAISIGTTRSPLDLGRVSDQVSASIDCTRTNAKPTCWKTRMCRKWETTGQCHFGENCHFAHSLAEMYSSGGHYEVEMANAGIAPAYIGNDIIPSVTTIRSPTTQPSKRDTFLSKALKQIKGIYGDWIDTLSPEHGLPDEEK